MAFSCAIEDRYAFERKRSFRLLALIDLDFKIGSRTVLDGLPSRFCEAAETPRAPVTAFVCCPEDDGEDSPAGPEISHWPLLDVVCFEPNFINIFAVRVCAPRQFACVGIDPHGRRLISKIQQASISSSLASVPEIVECCRPRAFICAWVDPLKYAISHESSFYFNTNLCLFCRANGARWRLKVWRQLLFVKLSGNTCDRVDFGGKQHLQWLA